MHYLPFPRGPGLCASTAGATGLIPGQGIKILEAVRHGQKKQKQKPKKNFIKKNKGDWLKMAE